MLYAAAHRAALEPRVEHLGAELAESRAEVREPMCRASGFRVQGVGCGCQL